MIVYLQESASLDGESEKYLELNEAFLDAIASLVVPHESLL